MVLTLSNCATKMQEIQLSSHNSGSLQGKKIKVKVLEKAPFSAVTPINLSLGLIVGPILMNNSGKKIVSKNNVQDPAITALEFLSKELEKAYNVEVVSEKSMDEESYILELKTLSWGIHYTKTLDYIITYTSGIKMIDRSNSKSIAEGSCKYTPYNAYKKKELLADKAKILKDEFKKASDECAKLFKNTVFNINS